MPIAAQQGAEPIPGYQLLERLGAGGFGEVWKCTAPGGLTKAIKIVYGHIDEGRAGQESKALRRIQTVRHPFLLSLERYEVIDSQLLIVMELADSSLLDRYLACCKRGGTRGIPRDELLGYLRDAADALDYMSERFGLQHLDIKPQNLLLVGERIKIADFGQVKDLQSTSATATGGLTPVYAPPELFDARISRFCDQYSLAIVYQEMLTGVRPFPGTTALQLASQHANSPPLLDPLSPQDRPVLARALAKIPEKRFLTCRMMVDALLQPRPYSVPPTSPSPPSPVAKEELDKTPTGMGDSILRRATEVGNETPSPPLPPPEPITDQPRHLPPAPPGPTGTIRYRPTLFLGIGGMAGRTLRRLRQRLHSRFAGVAVAPVLRLLLLDTDPKALQQAREGEPGQALDDAETLLAPLRFPEEYHDRSQELLRWLDRRWLYGIPHSLLTDHIRPLGRLALVDNATEILGRVREALVQLSSPEARKITTDVTGLGLRTEEPRVFLIASITGGTGGGMLLDLAYAVQQILADLRLSDKGLCGMLLFATDAKPPEQKLARVNACATLRELNHFSRPDVPYPGDPDRGLSPAGPKVAPFQECYLISLGDRLQEADADAATDLVAEYLYLDATFGGDPLDSYRRSTHVAYGAAMEPVLRTFGLYRINVPSAFLTQLVATRSCLHLVNTWRGTSGEQVIKPGGEREAPPAWWGELDEMVLGERFWSAARALCGPDPDDYFSRLLADTPPGQTHPAQPAPGKEMGRLLSKADEVLGRGEDNAGGQVEKTALAEAVGQQAAETTHRLNSSIQDWLLGLGKDPRGGLFTADRAARQLLQRLQNATEAVRSQRAEVSGQRALLRRRLEGDISAKETGLSRLLRFLPKPASTGEKAQVFPAYCQMRFAEIALKHALEVFGTVTHLVMEFIQDSTLCRQKLGQLAAMFQHQLTSLLAEAARPDPVPNRTVLLPGQTTDLAQAADILFKGMTPETFGRLVETVGTELLKPQGGLRQLLVNKRDLFQTVKDELFRWAWPIAVEALGGVDAAQLFLQAQQEPGRAGQTLLAHVQAAAPRLPVSEGWQRLVVAIPAGPAGETVRNLVTGALPDMPITPLQSEGDILLVQEAANLSLWQVVAELSDREPGYLETAQKVLTRTDVAWSPLELEET